MTVVFLFGYLLWMNWKLTLVMVAILPIIGVMVTQRQPQVPQAEPQDPGAMGDLTHVASETIQGYRVVRSFRRRGLRIGRFRAPVRTIRQATAHGQDQAPLHPGAAVGHLFSAMAVVLVLVLAAARRRQAGDLVAYITAAGMLPKPIRQLSEVSSTIQKGLAGAESIFAQLDETRRSPITDASKSERLSGRSRSATSRSPTRAALPRVLDTTSASSSNPGRWSPSSGARGAASRRWRA
jgi:subfamily B ATP-binding cassette protein MsbA